MSEQKSAYKILSGVNVNGHTEKKNGLTYLSWAWAWGTLLEYYPDATYTIYENSDGLFYHTDGRTCWVKTGVTVEGKEYIEYLPIMDFKNRSIPLESVTSFDVNKAIQRSLTKAVARHGLGLYIYAGEDLPADTAAADGSVSNEALAAMVGELDKEVRTKVKDMTPEQKRAFAKACMIPVIGSANYLACKEPDKIKKLLELVKAYAP